jgi:hypothetical protein
MNYVDGETISKAAHNAGVDRAIEYQMADIEEDHGCSVGLRSINCIGEAFRENIGRDLGGQSRHRVGRRYEEVGTKKVAAEASSIMRDQLDEKGPKVEMRARILVITKSNWKLMVYGHNL